MNSIVIVILTFFYFSLKEKSIQYDKDTVIAYSIPLYSTYMLRVSEHSIKKIENCKKSKSSNINLVNELTTYFSKIPKKRICGAKSIDIRVLIEVHYQNGEMLSVSFDSAGNYKFNGKIYKENEQLTGIVERYFPDINWVDIKKDIEIKKIDVEDE